MVKNEFQRFALVGRQLRERGAQHSLIRLGIQPVTGRTRVGSDVVVERGVQRCALLPRRDRAPPGNRQQPGSHRAIAAEPPRALPGGQHDILQHLFRQVPVVHLPDQIRQYRQTVTLVERFERVHIAARDGADKLAIGGLGGPDVLRHTRSLAIHPISPANRVEGSIFPLKKRITRP